MLVYEYNATVGCSEVKKGDFAEKLNTLKRKFSGRLIAKTRQYETYEENEK